jgi:hypothetical protein
MEYKEIEAAVDVPANTGIKGFLYAIEGIIKLGRVQSIVVDAYGRITYRHFVREGEARAPLALNFETLSPSGVIRNSKLRELSPVSDNAAVAMSQLFHAAAIDHLNPVALVAGTTTNFWKWYEMSTGLVFTSHEELYGVPFLTDRMYEEHVLILCAAYPRAGALVDTQQSYKIVIPPV